MREALTQRQGEVLAAVQHLIETCPLPPTIREICGAMGVSSTNCIREHLDRLARKGYLRWEPSRARTIQLLSKERTPSPIPILEMWRGKPVSTTRIQAADRELLRNPLAIRMGDRTMTRFGILPRDLLLLERVERPRPGSIVGLLHGEDLVVRHLAARLGADHDRKTLVRLTANEEIPAMDLFAPHFRRAYLGTVRRVVRTMEDVGAPR